MTASRIADAHVTDPKKAVVALKWAVREMEERYKKMSKLGVRNIEGYNVRLAEAKAKGEKRRAPSTPASTRRAARRSTRKKSSSSSRCPSSSSSSTKWPT